MNQANYMQRIFDVLRGSPDLLTVEDLARITHFDSKTIHEAMRRLRRPPFHCLTSVCQNGAWRYGVKPSAQRPQDRRGARQ